MMIYLLLATLAGVGLAFQAVINARLGVLLNSWLWAAVVQVLVGLAFLILCLGVARQPLPAFTDAGRWPWWIWIGGALGSAYVLTAIIVTRPLGAALTAGVLIVGQLTAALVIDHYGWFGVDVNRLSLLRITGAGLLLAGAVLIRWR